MDTIVWLTDLQNSDPKLGDVIYSMHIQKLFVAYQSENVSVF